MDWQECKDKELVKKINPDNNLINSLIESSKNKEKSATFLRLNETTSSSIITLYYDSLRILLEALAIKKGYKIYNHDCFSCFLKEIMKLENLSEEYNPLRKLRNSINCYGETIPLVEAKEVINEFKYLINKIKLLI